MQISEITLNISFVFYLIFLLPQIFHNSINKQLKNLSLKFHFVLFFSYLADLLFGFFYNMPWQYKSVSLIGLLCLFIQHFQLAKYYKNNIKTKNIFNLICIFILFILLIGFYCIFQKLLIPKIIVKTLNLISSIGFFVYLIPQLIQNLKNNNALALNINFLILGLLINIFDLLSVFLLNWTLITKISSFSLKYLINSLFNFKNKNIQILRNQKIFPFKCVF